MNTQPTSPRSAGPRWSATGVRTLDGVPSRVRHWAATRTAAMSCLRLVLRPTGEP